jgi:hypothetical protein
VREKELPTCRPTRHEDKTTPVVVRAVFYRSVLCKMRLSLLVAAAMWLVGVEAFVIPSPTRVARNVSPSQLMASREEIRQEALRAYRIKRGLEVPGTPAAVVPDTPPVVPDVPDPVVLIEAPKIVDTVPKIMDTPPALPDVTATPHVVVESVPRVGLEDGVDPISTFWRQLTGTVKTITPEVTVDVKMPDLSKVQMPDLSNVKMPDLSNVQMPYIKDLKLPEIPVRDFGQGITFPGSDEKIPTLLDFLKNSGVAPIRLEPLNTAGIQSSIATMKANLAGLAGWKGVLDTLKIGEYGAWYLAGSLLLAWQIQTKSQKGSFEKELKSAEQKAKQAAEAATLAAEGGTKARQLATSAKSATATTSSSAESMLAQSKLHQMQLEKETMKKELEYLRQQTEELQKELAKARTMENVNGQVEIAPAIEKKVELMPQDPDEDKRFLDIIKAKDLENVKAPEKKAPAPEKKPPPAPKKEKAPDRLLDVLREANSTTATVMAPAKTETGTATATATTTAPAPKKAAPKKAAPKKKAAAKKTAKNDDVVVMAQPTLSKPVNETSFFVSKVERERKSEEKPAPKAVVDVETPGPKAEETKADNPWSSLSESTLKRKTVKELTAYLSERGIESSNDQGKPKSKQDLVKAVLTL